MSMEFWDPGAVTGPPLRFTPTGGVEEVDEAAVIERDSGWVKRSVYEDEVADLNAEIAAYRAAEDARIEQVKEYAAMVRQRTIQDFLSGLDEMETIPVTEFTETGETAHPLWVRYGAVRRMLWDKLDSEIPTVPTPMGTVRSANCDEKQCAVSDLWFERGREEMRKEAVKAVEEQIDVLKSAADTGIIVWGRDQDAMLVALSDAAYVVDNLGKANNDQ